MADGKRPLVVLFGYDSSPFTNKVRLVLRLKGVPFYYIVVPTMMPRPLLHNTFGLTYRKIPVLAIGRDIYCDTSLIIEALEHHFPTSAGYGTIYPPCPGMPNWTYRGLARGFASYWIDRPFFRVTTGLIPPSVWRTDFGTDRAKLIGHKLDPDKLEKKVPQNLSNLDLHLSILEPMVKSGTWVLPTKEPSLADISLYYQLRWGIDIAAGKGIHNLSSGGTKDTAESVADSVFSENRYPGLWKWFHAFESHVASYPDLERTIDGNEKGWKDVLKATPLRKDGAMLVPTAVAQHPSLDQQRGLVPGVMVSVAPDDTGRNDPTIGELVNLGVEEVVIKPAEKGEMDVRIHFPRLGFVVKSLDHSKL